ncbi:MAG TPA: nuclear transport factor 2 family protein [Thermoanaerobaculia bacterium]|nr:nuclear transport factor 2 family protein [Thermoanaerobaculia bacterium]
MSENDNITKMQQMYAAFGSGDITTILANVTDDCDWGTATTAQEIPWYRIRQGRDGVADFFQTLASEVNFQRFEPNLYAAAGDDVLVHLDYTYEIKRNGKVAPSTAVHRFTFRDGKVSRFRAYEDTAAIRDAYNG